MPSGVAGAALVAALLVLAVSGAVPTWPGLAHAVGLPPLDLSFDLRVLVARAPSWPVFAVGVAASIAVRAAVLSAASRAVLGAQLPLRRAAAFYALATVPLSIGAALAFSGLAAVYAWYAYAGLAVEVATVVAFGVWLVARAPDASVPRSFALVAVYLVSVGVLGAVARLAGGWAVLVVVPSAVLTYATLRSAGRRGSGGRPRRATAGAAVALVLLAASPARVPRHRGEAVLFLVPGVDTSTGRGALYRLDPAGLGFPCDRVVYYSYRGPGGDAVDRGEARCPLAFHEPYRRADTQRPLAELVEAFSTQLDATRVRHPGVPVVVATHSQGAWIAWEALARGEARGVTDLVMLAPSTRTPVGYPAVGQTGPGTLGVAALRLLSATSQELGVGAFDPDAPLARELLASPAALETLFGRPLPTGVDAIVVAAAFDAPVAPEGWGATGADVVVVDTTHTGITTSPRALDAVRAALARDTGAGSSVVASMLRGALDPFMPPPA